jgi:predicted acyl esterase
MELSFHSLRHTIGADTDFAVRVTGVSPSGDHHLLIGEGIRRPELRDDFAIASPVVSGTRCGLTVELISDLAYTFAACHRLGLIITSRNFPRFAQNPNNGDE